MPPIIKINNVKFLDIIEYPTIEINEFETTFIRGESGCGKSTLLNLINGITSNDFGEITYLSNNIKSYNSISIRKEILLCSQSFYLFDKTIIENFNEYYSYLDLPNLSKEQITYYLNICCLNFPLDTHCANMSGGERHRVFIAICLSFIPKVIMLDEPTAALDSENANNLISHIKQFCIEKRITLIIVCHNEKLAKAYGDKIILLESRKKI